MSEALITTGDLKEFQRLSESAMDSLCDIFEPTTVRAPGSGVSTTTWAEEPNESGVPCRLTTIQAPDQALTADQLRTAARWAVTMPLGTVVTEKARLRVTGTDVGGNDFSVLLDVAGLDTPKSFAVHVKVFATLVTT